MKKLLPIILLILGLAGGAGAGLALKPPGPANLVGQEGGGAAAHGGAPGPSVGYPPAAVDPRPEGLETVRMPNQFVVPLIEDGRVRALVVISLALELLPDSGFEPVEHDARLRAVLLQVLFDHANSGAFDGVFTAGDALLGLRRLLREAAVYEMGPIVHDVLITELLRQENS